MRKNILYILLILLSSGLQAQQKTYTITRIDRPPIIDGKIDPMWDSIPAATGFVQYEPENGHPATKKTIVKLVYTKKAVYILAINNDEPKKINSYLSPRDATGQADWFGIYIDPFNNGRIAYCFIVTAGGVQIDKKIIGTSEDYSWDAVWKSKVRKTSFGWIAEMKIPFSQLRFPNKKQQVWAINFLRNIQRRREISSWNPMDVKQPSIITQMGKLYGLKDISKKIHLELYPYTSYYVEKWSDRPNIGRYINGGMDIKLGLNNSTTIDMMLIPDFGEVQSDDPVLNLSPYETYYREKRQFFTEGTEIFKIGNIFYSRRIGGQPAKYSEVEQMLSDNEIIENNPISTQIINATKITGKTKGKFSYGIINALTDNTYATVIDTITHEERKILTEPLTNYNVIAASKDLQHGSYIGFINTNKTIFQKGYYISNASAIETNLKNKSETFRIFSRFSYSTILPSINLKPENGYAYALSFDKIKGNIKFGLSRSLYSDKYFINDMGYLTRNNIISHSIYLSYTIYRPVWIIRQWRNILRLNHQMLYNNHNLIGTFITLQSYGTLKNLASSGIIINLSPTKVYDYFEPRVENFVYIKPPTQNYRLWYSTDYSRKAAIDLQAGFYFPSHGNSQQEGGWLLISPRMRMGNWGLLVYSAKGEIDINNYGYVGQTDNQDSVIFGQRNIRTLENVINMEASFSPNTHLSFKARHYWSVVRYINYYALQSNGQLNLIHYSYRFIPDQNQNFNTFNIEVIFKWQFLPGSELSVVYRKQINSLSDKIIQGYYQNFTQFYNETPALNTLIFKIVLYI